MTLAVVRAAATALNERPCWLAELAMEPLAQADFPKLVMLSAWDPVPPGYRPRMAHTMRAVSTTVAERIGAALLRVPGAGHEPQREVPDFFNAALAGFGASRLSGRRRRPRLRESRGRGAPVRERVC